MDLFDTIYNHNVENGSGPNVLLDSGFRKQFPQLHDFIVKTSHNGFKREHGRVTLTAENGLFKISLADPTGKCSFSITAETIEQGLQSMENHAANSAVHWYYWPSRAKSARTAKN